MAANRRAGDSSAQASERHMGEPAPALDCVSKCWSASNNVGRKPLSRSPARDGWSRRASSSPASGARSRSRCRISGGTCVRSP